MRICRAKGESSQESEQEVIYYQAADHLNNRYLAGSVLGLADSVNIIHKTCFFVVKSSGRKQPR